MNVQPLLRRFAVLVLFLAGTCAPTTAQSHRLPRITIDDLEYIGAFRLSSRIFGQSSLNYAEGL